MKKVLIKLRTSIKLVILISIAIFLIIAAVVFFYKPIYSVTFNGEQIGYCADKSELQKRINEYIETGDGSTENLAFVAIDEMPTYKLCLLKRGITTNDEEIFQTIAETGTAYYKYYAILEDEEEKAYVANFEDAEKIVEELKDKESNNIDDITIDEKYETKLEEFADIDDAVSDLYEKKPVVVVARTTQSTSSSGTVKTSTNISKSKPSIGISLIKPITGTITSRFGSVSSIRSSAHTGLDIAAPYGTSIKAAASGTVVFSGSKGSYGYMIAISHGNGVQTYYAHCSKLYASVGQYVSQGEVIAAVGSTGNSTGNHLHLEVRVNGVAYNPQNYVY